nr:hypothetical protein [Tanacetum cinerariifolium]
MAGALHQYLAVKLGYDLADLMYYHFLILKLGLDYGLYPLNVNADVLEMAKYVNDYKIILVYVEHESSIFVTPKKRVSIAVDNHLRKGPIEIDSSPDVNRNLTPIKSCPVGKFKEVEVDADNESEEESDTKGDYTNPKHDLSIGVVEVQEDDLDVIDYDLFGSDLDDGIDSERRIQLRELRRIGKHKNNGPNKYYFYLGQQFAFKKRVTGRIRMHSVETRRKLIMGVHAMDPYPGQGCHGPIDLFNVLAFTHHRIDVQQEPNPESMARTFRRVYVCLGALKQGFRACGRENLGLDGCFMSGPWPGQILTAVGVDANNEIYPVAYDIVEAESKASWCWFLNLLGEDLGKVLIPSLTLTFQKDLYKPLQVCFQVLNIAKATYVGEFNKKMAELKSFHSAAYDWKWELTGIPCKHVVAAIYNMSENSVGVAILEQWVHVAYKLETRAHVYSFKRKKSHDEIANESCSPGKLSRKGKSVRCGKCGNKSHNRKGCRGQGGATQVGRSSARNVFGQGGARRTAGARNVTGQASARQVAGARTVSGQAGGANNVSSQSGGYSQPIAAQSTSTGARNASSQPSAAPSTTSQRPTQHSAGPRQGFQAPRPGFPTQRLTKTIASRHNPRKLSF